MALIVQKFGGTSVADIERIRKVGKIVQKEYKAGHKLVIVVSAMAGTTNSLISNCSEISNLNSYDHLQEYDAVVGSGEILSAGLLALELQNLGLNARSLQGWQIPILTDDVFAHAQVKSINSEFLHNLINNNVIPVITGFQGVTDNRQITTLGKGGSDTTAALIAAAIGASRADIYTDVVGIFTADPRVVHDATKINLMSTNMVLDLSEYGAKVLHPRAALAAARYNFDMRILSSFEEDEGTLITNNELNMENRIITAITSNKNILQIEIFCEPDNFSILIKRFAEEGIIIDKVSMHDANNIKLIANLADKNKLEAIVQNLKKSEKIISYGIKTNISTVTMVGYGIKNDNGISFYVINLLAEHHINVKEIDVNNTKFTAMLEDQDTEKAIKILHTHFKINLI